MIHLDPESAEAVERAAEENRAAGKHVAESPLPSGVEIPADEDAEE